MALAGLDQEMQPSPKAEDWLTNSAPLRYEARASAPGVFSLTAHTEPALSTHITWPLKRPMALNAWVDVAPG